MLQKLHLYDTTKGKAYSYFGTIAKRYLIAYCQRNYNRVVEKKSIENVDNDERTIDMLIMNPNSSGELEKCAQCKKELNDDKVATVFRNKKIYFCGYNCLETNKSFK